MQHNVGMGVGGGNPQMQGGSGPPMGPQLGGVQQGGMGYPPTGPMGTTHQGANATPTHTTPCLTSLNGVGLS